MTALDVATEYAERREHDWSAFVAERGPAADYWSLWEERSFGWKVPIEFVQPLGLDVPDVFQPLEPLFEALRESGAVDVPPVPWLHLTYCRVGFLRPVDVLWSQVESFYVNAAPRIRRVEPFTLRLGGISVADGERIYLGVDDRGSYREVRRQLKLGVPKIYEVMKDDPEVTPEGDRFMPVVDLGFMAGGARERVAEILEPYREVDLGEVPLTHLKMARMPIQPHDHYVDIDVIAEIPLLGEDHRKGYHN